MHARGGPGGLSDGEVINHTEDVEKSSFSGAVEVYGRQGGELWNAPENQTTEAIIAVVKISATAGQPGAGGPNNG